MPQPSPDVDILFEELLQDLPPETAQMAREFKAFTRSRKSKTPVQLLWVVLLYCGLDTSLREVAGHVTLLGERITDTSVAERLAACRPGVQALLAHMLPRPGLAALSAPHRFLVIDASGIHAPGARGTQYRLPDEQANRARQVCRKRHSNKGHQPNKSTLFLAGWVVVLTSLLPTLLPGPTALALYWVRWQIEVAMKRWTSLLDADLLRARYGSPLADVWLQGKWLYALLLDRRLRRSLGDGWSRLDGERLAT